MSIYYRDSGLTWGQYLQADSFVQDVTGEIKRSGEGIKTAISDQTRNIVASNDALARDFGEGFDSVNSTLEWGFGRVVSEISELRAEFSYGMGLVLEQLRIQQRTLDSILDRLDAIHETLKHPLLTQARELSKRGMERLQRALLPEALKDLAETEIRNLIQQVEQLLHKDTYFDYLDAMPLLKQAQQAFARVGKWVMSQQEFESLYQRRRKRQELLNP